MSQEIELSKGVTHEDAEKLAALALKARERSYSPYSHFQVGAALLAADGTVYQGCNIENAAYSPSVCAERTAIFKAVSENRQDFKAIAIAGGPAGAQLPLPACSPCGVCRQVLMEFCDPDSFEIILVRSQTEFTQMLLRYLLPLAFGPGNLRKKGKRKV